MVAARASSSRLSGSSYRSLIVLIARCNRSSRVKSPIVIPVRSLDSNGFRPGDVAGPTVWPETRWQPANIRYRNPPVDALAQLAIAGGVAQESSSEPNAVSGTESGARSGSGRYHGTACRSARITDGEPGWVP